MMEYKGYVGLVEFDDEAGILHGEVVNIRDVVTFQGKTVDEVRTAFQESIEDYLSFCQQRGESPDQPLSPGLVQMAGLRLGEIRKSLHSLLFELATQPK